LDEAEPDLRLAGLSLWVVSRERPDDSDYWDGNWLNIRARVEDAGALVKIAGPWVRSDELQRFADELGVLDRDLKGTAELDCIEPMLRAKVTCGVRGDIEVTVEITPDYPTQAHRFTFMIDQSYFGTAPAGLARVLERFPVKGKPTA
jgi:hypothetical protein